MASRYIDVNARTVVGQTVVDGKRAVSGLEKGARTMGSGSGVEAAQQSIKAGWLVIHSIIMDGLEEITI